MILTRKEAKSLGLKSYFGGKICNKCGGRERYVSSGDCLVCRNTRDKNWRLKVKGDPIYKQVRYIRGVLTRMKRKIHNKDYLYYDEVLGYSCQEIVDHLEYLWKPGMNWNNHGEWHIDHIKPFHSFIREGIFDPAVIHSLDNLQPLWSWENNLKRKYVDKNLIGGGIIHFQFVIGDKYGY